MSKGGAIYHVEKLMKKYEDVIQEMTMELSNVCKKDADVGEWTRLRSEIDRYRRKYQYLEEARGIIVLALTT